MNPNDLPEIWRAGSSRPFATPEADWLLLNVRRDARRFDRTILWRDIREVGIAFVLIPTWLVLGWRQSLPWTWYLAVPVLTWTIGFLLWHRAQGGRLAPKPDDPLRQQLLGSLRQVERQVWLLRNVAWWALVPFGLAGLVYIGQAAWLERTTGWLWLVAPAMAAALIVGVLTVVGLLNDFAIRTELEPRRRELAALLASLADEPPDPAQPNPASNST